MAISKIKETDSLADAVKIINENFDFIANSGDITQIEISTYTSAITSQIESFQSQVDLQYDRMNRRVNDVVDQVRTFASVDRIEQAVQDAIHVGVSTIEATVLGYYAKTADVQAIINALSTAVNTSIVDLSTAVNASITNLSTAVNTSIVDLSTYADTVFVSKTGDRGSFPATDDPDEPEYNTVVEGYTTTKDVKGFLDKRNYLTYGSHGSFPKNDNYSYGAGDENTATSVNHARVNDVMKYVMSNFVSNGFDGTFPTNIGDSVTASEASKYATVANTVNWVTGVVEDSITALSAYANTVFVSKTGDKGSFPVTDEPGNPGYNDVSNGYTTTEDVKGFLDKRNYLTYGSHGSFPENDNYSYGTEDTNIATSVNHARVNDVMKYVMSNFVSNGFDGSFPNIGNSVAESEASKYATVANTVNWVSSIVEHSITDMSTYASTYTDTSINYVMTTWLPANSYLTYSSHGYFPESYTYDYEGGDSNEQTSIHHALVGDVMDYTQTNFVSKGLEGNFPNGDSILTGGSYATIQKTIDWVTGNYYPMSSFSVNTNTGTITIGGSDFTPYSAVCVNGIGNAVTSASTSDDRKTLVLTKGTSFLTTGSLSVEVDPNYENGTALQGISYSDGVFTIQKVNVPTIGTMNELVEAAVNSKFDQNLEMEIETYLNNLDGAFPTGADVATSTSAARTGFPTVQQVMDYVRAYVSAVMADHIQNYHTQQP